MGSMKAAGVAQPDGLPTDGGKKQPLVRIALEASARAVDQLETPEACTPSPALGSPLPPLRVRYDAVPVRSASAHVCLIGGSVSEVGAEPVAFLATAGAGGVPGLAIHTGAALQQLCMR